MRILHQKGLKATGRKKILVNQKARRKGLEAPNCLERVLREFRREEEIRGSCKPGIRR